MVKKARDDEITITEALVRRLDVIIRALLERVPPAEGASRSAYDQSLFLAKAGLSPTEIAGITGRHRNNVSRDLSTARKKRRRKSSRS